MGKVAPSSTGISLIADETHWQLTLDWPDPRKVDMAKLEKLRIKSRTR